MIGLGSTSSFGVLSISRWCIGCTPWWYIWSSSRALPCLLPSNRLKKLCSSRLKALAMVVSLSFSLANRLFVLEVFLELDFRCIVCAVHWCIGLHECRFGASMSKTVCDDLVAEGFPTNQHFLWSFDQDQSDSLFVPFLVSRTHPVYYETKLKLN